MTRSRKLSITAALSLAILAACGGGGGGPVGDATPQFGQSFAAAFRAVDTAEPIEPGPIVHLAAADTNEAARLMQEPVDF
jgi:hypothetical protein